MKNKVKCFQKLLAVLLCIAMFSALMVPTVSAETDADGYTLIYTQDDLSGISMSGKYRLANDIELTGNWTPLGTFTGTLDGNGYKITGLKIVDAATSSWAKAGFFQVLNGGTICNLTLEGSVTNTTNQSIELGVFAGETQGAAKIENCVSNVNVTTTNTAKNPYVGGFVGLMKGSTVLKDCVNNGLVTVKTSNMDCHVGGFVGQSQGGQLINCVNNNTITTDIGSGTYGGTGGILGTTAKAVVKIQECINNGDVNGAKCVGGIAGYLNYTASSIKGCLNFGDVTSVGECAAGIVGYVLPATIQDCINFGTVTSGGQYAAGIVGYTTADGTNEFTFSYLANVGSISANAAAECFVGGVFGRERSNYATFSYLYNGATDISAPNKTKGYVNGISGAEGNNGFDHCYSVAVPGATHTSVFGYGRYGSATYTNWAILTDANMESVLTALNHENATLTYRVNTAKVQNGEGAYEDVTRIEPIYDLTEVPATTIGLQLSDVDADTDTYSIRFVSVVNSLNYDEAGVVISAVIHTTDAEGNPITLNVEEEYPIDTVYTSVLVETDEGEETMVAPFGTYFLTCKMLNIDAADTIEFSVTPYTTLGGTKTSGETMIVTVYNGEVQ